MQRKLFISYSHDDEAMLVQLHKHLAQLKREGAVSAWYDRKVVAGGRIDEGIEAELESADLFLACASPDWIASQYAYEREFQRALEREAEGQAQIVPVIFRPCDWLSTPLKDFRALPRDGKPITEFVNQDVAFLDVVTELRRLVASRPEAREFKSANLSVEKYSSEDKSRYKVKREFDQLHKRDFVESAFAEIYRFFEVSVSEISTIEGIEARLSPQEGGHFSCTVINRGLSRGFETLHVRQGGSFSAIDILYGEQNSRKTSNGGFTVRADEYQLQLVPLMFRMSGEDRRVNPRDAGKMLWDDLLGSGPIKRIPKGSII